MKEKLINVRVNEKEKAEIEQFVKDKTEFDNLSDYIRSVIRRDMRKKQEKK